MARRFDLLAQFAQVIQRAPFGARRIGSRSDRSIVGIVGIREWRVRCASALAIQIRAHRFQLVGIDLTFKATRLAAPVPAGISSIIKYHPTGWPAWSVGFAGAHGKVPLPAVYYRSALNRG